MRKVLPKTARNEFLHDGRTMMHGLFKESEIELISTEISKLPIKRDLFRQSEMLKKLITKKDLLSPLGDLTSQSSFRLVMDQVLFHEEKESITLPLSSQFCFQDLKLALLVALSDNENAEGLYPKEKGSVSIFKPSEQICLNAPSGHYYLIVYGTATTLYIKEDRDPYCHSLKKLGLSFGDCLPNDLNPLVFL
jgi:hypothetical protein